jgi:membrane protease YdiL (CAAX protease family)
VGLFYLGFVVALWTQHILGPFPTGASVGEMVIAMISFQGAALVLITCFLREQGTSWKEAFGLSNNARRAVVSGILVACLFLPVGMSLQRLSFETMKHFSPNKPQEQQAVQTLRIASSWLDRVVLGVVTILLAPVAEETLFRGILYPAIKQAGFPKLAFWLASIAFAAVHLNVMVFVPLLVLAMFLTVLYEKTDNLLAPITAHAAFNAIEFATLYLLDDRLNGLK